MKKCACACAIAYALLVVAVMALLSGLFYVAIVAFGAAMSLLANQLPWGL